RAGDATAMTSAIEIARECAEQLSKHCVRINEHGVNALEIDAASKRLAALLTDIRLETRLEEVRSLQVYLHSSQKHIPVARLNGCSFQVCVDLQERIAALEAERRKAGGTQ